MCQNRPRHRAKIAEPPPPQTGRCRLVAASGDPRLGSWERGLALRAVPVSLLTRSIRWSYRLGLAAALAGGILLFLPRAVAYASNRALGPKLAILAAAILIQHVLQTRASAVDDGEEASAVFRAAAGASLLLWFTVGAAGRAIGFV